MGCTMLSGESLYKIFILYSATYDIPTCSHGQRKLIIYAIKQVVGKAKVQVSNENKIIT